jgi:NAD(P)-dependent dehydrogenase (short-subunit alcohol dehydrogenase family)
LANARKNGAKLSVEAARSTQIMSKIALITGANKGLGLETARQLARDHGFEVLLGCRNAERGEQAQKQLQSEA